MDPETVRALAEHYGLEEVFHCPTTRLLLLETATSPDVAGHVIAVWYDTSTVGVILPHPRRRRIQSFFFNVTTAQLRDILAQPNLNRELNYAGPDWITHAPSDVESEESALRRQLAALEFEQNDILREKAALQARLNVLAPPTTTVTTKKQPSLAELEDRRRVLTEEVHSLERHRTQGESESAARRGASAGSSGEFKSRTFVPKHAQLKKGQRSNGGRGGPHEISDSSAVQGRAQEGSSGKNSDQEEDDNEGDNTKYGRGDEDDGVFTSQKSVYLNRSASSVQRDSPARYKGNRCLFSFSNEDYQEEFGKSWSRKPVSTVALGRGYLIVYEDGGVAWWDVPSGLDRKFRDEEARLPPVQYVALGPEGNYFVKFTNGKMEWVAKQSFQRCLKAGASEKSLYVDKVALGANGSWVILWTDGTVNYEGVPRDLAAQLDAIKEGPGLRDISLGPHGEWFAIFKDHSVQANNLPTQLHNALARIKQTGGRVRSVAFGEMQSWYVRYWDGS